MDDLALELHRIGAIRFGEFRLKSGLLSHIYVDLRQLVSYPSLLQGVAGRIWKQAHALSFDCICGVPYTALPIATAISLKESIPMVMRRKEVKQYGTRRTIEGSFQKGQKCLVVEDLITSGASVLETVDALEAEGLHVSDAILLLDREQGGRHNLARRGITVHSLFTLREVIDHCISAGCIDQAEGTRVCASLYEARPFRKELSFGERAQVATNATARKLFQLMEEKQTNLGFNPDVATSEELLKLVDLVGPEICLLKTHIDLLEDFDQDLIASLQTLARRDRFLIFEDRKFADIGSVVQKQYQGGIYRIADWADITNAHMVPGPGIIEGLRQIGMPKGRGLMLLAEMSSQGALATGSYTEQTVKYALENRDFVIGFIAMRRLTEDPGFIHLTPGVQLQEGSDALMQQYRTPDLVVRQQGTDIIQVGRDIYRALDPLQMAKKYRKAGWEAYEQRLVDQV